MAKELNPYSTSQSANANPSIQNYMMDLGQSPYGAPLPQENAVGPSITQQTNPADGSQVTTGENDVAINSQIPKPYGPGTGVEANPLGAAASSAAPTDTIIANKDENPNEFIA